MAAQHSCRLFRGVAVGVMATLKHSSAFGWKSNLLTLLLDSWLQAEVSPPIAGTQSHNNGNGIITASDAQSAASEPGKKLRIAFVGGKDLKDLQRRMLPLNAEVRLLNCFSNRNSRV